ncbi:unnamed protein product [Caenorhabditis bovis]|uniref:Uncharacterized protein n=1 Tax=Caenorhabditis bovis TaxID=2654633 RepID=A0A8S1F5H3_9PELO|nr:unnamed protein product [Caenorhabditis bovis]
MMGVADPTPCEQIHQILSMTPKRVSGNPHVLPWEFRMNYTYAEIEQPTYVSITDHSPPSLNVPPSPYAYSDSSAECRLSRYRMRSAAEKSDGGYSSGYSSSSSTSLTTVINGARPYEETKTTTIYTFAPPPLPSPKSMNVTIPPPPQPEVRPCCIQCREKELKEMIPAEHHQYENFQRDNTFSKCKEVEPYIFLMLTMFRNLRKDKDTRKLQKIQQRVEKLMRFEPRLPFAIENASTFERQLKCFAREVEVRLRAINDVSPDTFRDVSARFCEALNGSGTTRTIKNFVKDVKKLFK